MVIKTTFYRQLGKTKQTKTTTTTQTRPIKISYTIPSPHKWLLLIPTLVCSAKTIPVDQEQPS